MFSSEGVCGLPQFLAVFGVGFLGDPSGISVAPEAVFDCGKEGPGGGNELTAGLTRLSGPLSPV